MPNTVAATDQTLSAQERDNTAAGHPWNDREASVDTMVPLIGRLFRSYGVSTAVYGRSLVNQDGTLGSTSQAVDDAWQQTDEASHI